MDKGKLIGGAVVVSAAVALWLWPRNWDVRVSDDAVRPIRSIVVAVDERMPDLSFAGTVKATESRKLAFKQSGRVERIPVSKSQAMKKGEKLAWLDPLDFENRLAQAEAAVKRDRLTYQRKGDAAKKNAISQEELSQSEAQLKQSEAALALAQRALEETVLVAPFDCTVADVPASELDMVDASATIVVIQDLSKVKVEVVYPEAAVIIAKKLKMKPHEGRGCVNVSFDSFPGKSYPATFVEFTAMADEKTQTYLATYVMDPPEDLMLLPGMSATVTVSGDSYRYEDVADTLGKIAVPESAVGADVAGGNFVWKLVAYGADGVFEVRKTPVTVSYSVGDRITVAKGLEPGDRIATAGVAVLSEGAKVRLMKE